MPDEDLKLASALPLAPTQPAPVRRLPWKLLAGAAALLVILCVAIPKILHALRSVSTGDAYVNSYVTFVAPRVTGQVGRVFVEDNNRVQKGDTLLTLDPEPYQVQIAIKQAAADTAQADLVVANATSISYGKYPPSCKHGHRTGGLKKTVPRLAKSGTQV